MFIFVLNTWSEHKSLHQCAMTWRQWLRFYEVWWNTCWGCFDSDLQLIYIAGASDSHLPLDNITWVLYGFQVRYIGRPIRHFNAMVSKQILVLLIAVGQISCSTDTHVATRSHNRKKFSTLYFFGRLDPSLAYYIKICPEWSNHKWRALSVCFQLTLLSTFSSSDYLWSEWSSNALNRAKSTGKTKTENASN